jgi:hypothetical protein
MVVKFWREYIHKPVVDIYKVVRYDNAQVKKNNRENS